MGIIQRILVATLVVTIVYFAVNMIAPFGRAPAPKVQPTSVYKSYPQGGVRYVDVSGLVWKLVVVLFFIALIVYLSRHEQWGLTTTGP